MTPDDATDTTVTRLRWILQIAAGHAKLSKSGTDSITLMASAIARAMADEHYVLCKQSDWDCLVRAMEADAR